MSDPIELREHPPNGGDSAATVPTVSARRSTHSAISVPAPASLVQATADAAAAAVVPPRRRQQFRPHRDEEGGCTSAGLWPLTRSFICRKAIEYGRWEQVGELGW